MKAKVIKLSILVAACALALTAYSKQGDSKSESTTPHNIADSEASDGELAALGKARGEAVQAALLSSGELDPARVFLATNVPLKVHEGKVRMELAMK